MSEKQKAPSMAELLAQLASMQQQLAAANAATEQARKEAEAAKVAAAAGKKARAPKSHEQLLSSSAWYRVGYAARAIDPAIVTGNDSYGRAAGRALAIMFDESPGNLAGGNIRQYVARSANVLAGYIAAESNTASEDTIRRYKALYDEFSRYASDASLTAEQIDAAKQAAEAAPANTTPAEDAK